jgi:hypothetical protein
MDYNFSELMTLLDWNNSEINQKKGRENAKSFKDLSIFMQPLTDEFNKNVWDNCAMILCEKTDDELEPYIICLLKWLQDLNWPGALSILRRLSSFSYQESMVLARNKCIEQAKKDNDSIWIDNMMKI